MISISSYRSFLRSTQSNIARNCERELKAEARGTLGGLAMFHWVCEAGEQWQAYTNGLLLRLDSIFYTEVEMPGRAVGIDGLKNFFSSNKIFVITKKKARKVILREYSTLGNNFLKNEFGERRPPRSGGWRMSQFLPASRFILSIPNACESWVLELT